MSDQHEARWVREYVSNCANAAAPFVGDVVCLEQPEVGEIVVAVAVEIARSRRIRPWSSRHMSVRWCALKINPVGRIQRAVEIEVAAIEGLADVADVLERSRRRSMPSSE